MRPAFVAPLLVALSVACAPVTYGQRADRDGARLALGVDSLDVFVLSRGAERRVGRLWDELRRVEVSGIPLVRRVYRVENALFGATLDTTYSTWPDLRPHAHKSKARTYATDVRYRSDSVFGSRSVTPGTVVQIVRRLSASVTDASSFDLLIRASALSSGFRLSLSAYLAPQDSVASLSAIVTGAETWRTGLTGPTMDVWVVQMDFAGLSSTLWIDKATHALVRQTIRLAQDMTMLFSRPNLARVGAR